MSSNTQHASLWRYRAVIEFSCIVSVLVFSFFFYLLSIFYFVPTIRATQLVLKAHKEAVNSLSGNGNAKLGTVATVVAAANSTALECSKEIESAMQISMRNALGAMMNKTSDGPMDDLTIMKVNNLLLPSSIIIIISIIFAV